MSATETGLFPDSDYEVPFPHVDGHNVDTITLKLTGTINLNRHDPEHTALAESLTLGRYVQLDVLASVIGKTQAAKAATEHNTGEVEYTIHLKAHTADPA